MVKTVKDICIEAVIERHRSELEVEKIKIERRGIEVATVYHTGRAAVTERDRNSGRNSERHWYRGSNRKT